MTLVRKYDFRHELGFPTRNGCLTSTLFDSGESSHNEWLIDAWQASKDFI